MLLTQPHELFPEQRLVAVKGNGELCSVRGGFSVVEMEGSFSSRSRKQPWQAAQKWDASPIITRK